MVDRDVGARLLRQLREGRGWSWADLARALRDTARRLAVASLMDRQVSSIQRTVARWESVAERTCPGDRYQFLLAHLFARTRTGDVSLGPGSEFSALLDALRHFGTPPDRIDQLIALVARTASNEGNEGNEILGLLPSALGSSVATAQRGSTRLGHDALLDLRNSVTEINGRIGSTPFVRLQLQLAPAVEACRRLLRPSDPDPQDELVLLAITTYALAARLAFETRDDEMSMVLYGEATEVAGRLADRSHRAAVQTSRTMVTLHATQDLDAARTIARAATVDAHRGASHSVRARAHAVHAEICARAGHAADASAALDRAWKTVDQMTVDDPYHAFSGDQLNGFDGICALHAGDAGRAHDRLINSLGALRESRDAVQRGIVSTDLALARLRLGDVVACVDLLHQAVDTTASTGGRVSAQRIRSVRRVLRPWRAESFMAELDDHMHDTLLGS
jgi:hypothetical protein